MNKNGFFALLITAFILGTFGIWIRELEKSFGNTAQVIVRSGFASLTIILIILFRKVKFQIPKRSYKYLLGFSIVFPLSIIAFTVSATSIKVSNSLFMLYVGSILATYLWGRFAFGEKLTLKKVISIVLLVLGLYIFVYPFSAETLSLGVLMGLASGLFEGSAHAFRKFLKDIPREVIVFFQSASGVIVGFILFAFSKEPFINELSISAIVVGVLFGVLLVAIGYLLAYGFANYDVNIGTIILASELLFALIINYIVLQEVPTTNELVGGTLIFAGAIFTSIQLDKLTLVRKKRS